ncbi:MAG: 2-octaprenyl-6-methoxyphenyl hydroxylase [Gammaproteobacteria bacterium]
MQTHFDIIINGGGLAGNSLALALAHTSLTIGVIEPYPPSEPQRNLLESRTIALSHGACRIYQGMDVWSELAPHCTPIQHIHVSDKGHFGITRIHAKEQHMPALGYVLQIAEVNRVLSEKVKQHANIHYLCPAKIKQAHLIDNEWQLELESAQDAVQTIFCKLLIAADGGQSPLRQMAGLSAEEKDYQQTAIVTSVQLSRPHENIAYERFIADGPIALLPVKENVCAVIVTVANEKLQSWQAMTDTQFLQALQREFGYRLGRFQQIGTRVNYPLKLITTSKQTAPQFALVGNAAHALHPIAAQSFNLSLRDIATLAELITNAVKKQQVIYSAALLDEYVALRQDDQTRTVRFTDGLVEIFSSSFLALPRSIAMTGLDMVPPLKTLLGKYGAGTLGKLSRLGRGISI